MGDDPPLLLNISADAENLACLLLCCPSDTAQSSLYLSPTAKSPHDKSNPRPMRHDELCWFIPWLLSFS
jgi:hypothetical protein